MRAKENKPLIESVSIHVGGLGMDCFRVSPLFLHYNQKTKTWKLDVH